MTDRRHDKTHIRFLLLAIGWSPSAISRNYVDGDDFVTVYERLKDIYYTTWDDSMIAIDEYRVELLRKHVIHLYLKQFCATCHTEERNALCLNCTYLMQCAKCWNKCLICEHESYMTIYF